MKSKKDHQWPVKTVVLICAFSFFLSAVQAQITTDGTLGPATSLTGPNYHIKADLGQQTGGNLFHSFGQFNINTGEIATFTGPDAVSNIISRVTGGAPSRIDGWLRSEIPGADLYLLNPQGVIFGENAAMDIRGSFHLSTADYLRLGDNGRFDATHPGNSVLTTAPPSAFGFLEDKPAGIAIEGNIFAPKGETLSVTGGDIAIRAGSLSVENGQIHIAATASPGEVVPAEGGLEINASGEHGKVSVSNGGTISVSGDAAGKIYIRGGQFEIRDSYIAAVTTDADAGGVDIRVADDLTIADNGGITAVSLTESQGRAGDILLEAERIRMSNGGVITSAGYGSGRSGDISIRAGQSVTLSEAGEFPNLEASAYGSGEGGNISIDTAQLTVTSDGMILNAVIGEKDGGNIAVSTRSLRVDDCGMILSHTLGAGRGGDIVVESERLEISGTGQVSTDTSGSGDGGNLRMNVRESVIVSQNGRLATTGAEEKGGDAGHISISTELLAVSDDGLLISDTFGQGNGGDIRVEADRLEMNRGYMSSNSRSTDINAGSGGDISITARDSVTITGTGTDTGEVGSFAKYYGLYAQNHGLGPGGRITIKTDVMYLAQDAMINGQTYGGGPGGDVVLDVNRLEVHEGGTVTTSTRGAGDSGDISITAKASVNVSGAGMNAKNSWIYTATHSGGSGGDLTVSTPALTVGENGLIYSNTLGDDTWDGNTLPDGRAGNIRLNADHLELTRGGTVSASTECAGEGSNIELNVNHLKMRDAALISANSTGTGNAGNILFAAPADTIQIDKSTITTEAENAGGGKITINAGESLHLSDSRITTTVRGGSDDAGDIRIDPEFVTLNQSKIIAKAYEGKGGNIHIVADHFIRSSDSEVDASSQLGIDGSVVIESPDTDAGVGLTVLSATYPDASKWMKTPCTQRSGEAVSRFLIRARDGIPTSLDDWLPSPPFVFEDSESEELWRRGDFEHAVRYWEHALTVSEPETLPHLHTLLCLANAYQAVGHYRKALSAMKGALPAIRQSDDPYRKTLFFSTLGDIHLSLGDAEKAEKYLEEGLEHADSTENPLLLASVLNNRGNVFAANRDYRKATEIYTEGSDLIKQEPLNAKILTNMLRVRYLSGDYENIAEESENALLQTLILPDSHDKAANLISLGLIVREIREKLPSESRMKEMAYKALNQAKQIAENMGDTRIASYASGYMGQLYEAETRYSEAADLTRSAIFLAQQTYSPEILYLWQWQSGRLLRAMGDIENSVRAYQNAVATLIPVRGEFFAGYRDQAKDIFYRQIKPVCLGLADMFLTQAEVPGISEVRREKRLREARDTMELLKTAELQDFFEDECVMRKKRVSLNRVPAHTAILYPILFPDRLALLLTLPHGIKQITVPVDEGRIRKTVRRFQSLLQTRTSYEFRECAELLHEWLIRPVEDELAASETDTLIIAPDSILRVIPFAALHDDRDYLIERYAIGVVPGVTLTDPGSPVRNDIRLLAAGLSQARQGFAQLPNVRKELEDISEIAETTILLDKDYTIDNLREAFENHHYPILHMATHGVFGRTRKETFLLTYNDKLTMDRLDQLIALGRFRERPMELLTLSACQTALGDERAALGLAGVALMAGARSAVASLWLVDDEATYLMMSEFYRQIAFSDMSKARALQAAQKMLIEQTRYWHPIYWAPFLLVGNWL
ncbi:CHAT domain-containing protein [Desulfobacterales bacterium HSG2]|nr:CHAT domain-containing protein [Desulfobacterales bacterium HSG2]